MTPPLYFMGFVSEVPSIQTLPYCFRIFGISRLFQTCYLGVLGVLAVKTILRLFKSIYSSGISYAASAGTCSISSSSSFSLSTPAASAA